MRTYKVIYDLLDDMRAAMEGQLRSVEERIPLGAAEVRPRSHRVPMLTPWCQNCSVSAPRALW